MSSRGMQQDAGGHCVKSGREEEAVVEENEYDSAEDTEEASENKMGSMNQHTMDERMEIKEQMYQDKLANLMHQMDLLKQRQHPEYIRRVAKLEEEFEKRVLLNELYRDYLFERPEQDYIVELRAAEKDYVEKVAELTENLISDIEDRKKMIEHEFSTMELSGVSIDVKPTVTRKLRRRPNEPLPVPEKRRKPTTNQLIFLLDEKEIEHDLKLISRGKPLHSGRSQQHATNGAISSGSGTGPSCSNAASTSHNSSGNSSYSAAQSCSDHNGGSSSDVYGSAAQTVRNNIIVDDVKFHEAMEPSCSNQQQSSSQQQPLNETRIEDGKLWFERRWFHRGQPVYVEGKDIPRFSANISAIGIEGICVKKTSDGQKARIFLSHLRRGKVSIKRRAN